MINWLRPSNRSASVSLPFRLSKTYCFSILTQGSWRRSALSWSRSRGEFLFFHQMRFARGQPLLSRDDPIVHHRSLS
jgi:hypothetical protein